MSFMLQLTVDVLRANCDKEVENLESMMPGAGPTNSQDAPVVGTGRSLYLLLTEFSQQLD